MRKCAQFGDMKLIERGAHPRGCYFSRKTFAPVRLCETEANVNPTVFRQNQQARVTNSYSRVPFHDEPFAEAVRILMALVTSQPCACLLDGLVSSSGSEPHNDSVAEPSERCIGIP